MNTISYISLSEFQAYFPDIDVSKYSTTTLSGMIGVASKRVDNFLNYSLGIEDIINEDNESTVDTDGNLLIFTSKLPIVSLSSVTFKLGSYSNTTTLIDGNGVKMYDIPNPKAYIIIPYQQINVTGNISVVDFYSLRNRRFITRVSYRAGYETIPDDAKYATMLYLKDMIGKRHNPLGASSFGQGGINVAFRAGESDDIADAEKILTDYKRMSLF